MGVSGRGSQKGKIGQVGPGSSHSGSKHAREDRKALVSPALSQWCAGGWGWGWGRGWAVLINFFVLSFLFYLFVYLFVLLKAFDENLVVYVSKTIPYLGSFVHIYNVNISDTFERYVQSYIRIYFPTMV